MLPRSVSRPLFLLLFFALSVPLFAITGGPKDYDCPLCGTKNTFWAWYSYGSYIYHYPSKYQLVFWPFTSPKQLFHCKKCHFVAFAGDFTEPPKDKIEATRSLLRDVKLIYDTGLYDTIPMFERLEIAEKVYKLWGRSDEEWCHFYRVKGYHLDEEKQEEGAKAAREKALEYALKLYDHPERLGEKKHFLFVAGAMRFYTGDSKQALADLRAAAELQFRQPKATDENNQGYNEYLNGIIKEFIAAIEAGHRPDVVKEKDPH